MTSEQLAALAGIILSLCFSYIPGVSDWYAKREATQKRLIMAGLLFLAAAGTFGLSCAKILSTVACDRQGAFGLVYAFISALVSNQATFAISPKRTQA